MIRPHGPNCCIGLGAFKDLRVLDRHHHGRVLHDPPTWSKLLYRTGGIQRSRPHEQRPPSGGRIFKLFKINTSNYLLDF